MKKITLSLLGCLLISFSFGHTNASIAMAFANHNFNEHSNFSDSLFVANLVEQENPILNDFKMTPNPANSKFQLILPNGVKNAKLDVFDVLGKKIVTKVLSKLSSTIDVSKWNDGVYLVKITSDSGTHIKRFIKQ